MSIRSMVDSWSARSALPCALCRRRPEFIRAPHLMALQCPSCRIPQWTEPDRTIARIRWDVTQEDFTERSMLLLRAIMRGDA